MPSEKWGQKKTYGEEFINEILRIDVIHWEVSLSVPKELRNYRVGKFPFVGEQKKRQYNMIHIFLFGSKA